MPPRTRRHQLERQIAKLQKELEALPKKMDQMGVRELARAAGVSPTTATRAKRGDILSFDKMQKLLPFMRQCPCCKREMDEEAIKVAQVSFAQRKN